MSWGKGTTMTETDDDEMKDKLRKLQQGKPPLSDDEIVDIVRNNRKASEELSDDEADAILSRHDQPVYSSSAAYFADYLVGHFNLYGRPRDEGTARLIIDEGLLDEVLAVLGVEGQTEVIEWLNSAALRKAASDRAGAFSRELDDLGAPLE